MKILLPSCAQKRLATLTSFTALAVVIASGAALAGYSGTTSSGQVMACFKPGTGAVRIVDHFPCKAGEQTLTWNAKGRDGAAGAAGQDGTDGKAGQALEVTRASAAPTAHQALTARPDPQDRQAQPDHRARKDRRVPPLAQRATCSGTSRTTPDRTARWSAPSDAPQPGCATSPRSSAWASTCLRA